MTFSNGLKVLRLDLSVYISVYTGRVVCHQGIITRSRPFHLTGQSSLNSTTSNDGLYWWVPVFTRGVVLYPNWIYFHFKTFFLSFLKKNAGRLTDRMLDFLINDGARGASDGGFIDASWDARLPVSRHALAKRPTGWPARLLCRLARRVDQVARSIRFFQPLIRLRLGRRHGSPGHRSRCSAPGTRHAQ